MIKKISIILLGVQLLGAVLMTSCSAPAASPGDTVSVHYTLKLEDGTVNSTTNGHNPLKVTLGKNQLIPGFEEALIGMHVGEKKTIKVPPEKGYGAHRPELVEVISKSKLPASVPVEVGQQLQATGSDGKPMPVIITKVDGDNVTLDGNHPLAGQTLTFDVELVAISDNPATGSSNNRQTSLNWAILGASILVSGFSLFYLRRERSLRLASIRLRHGSDGLPAELAQLDDDFNALEKNYRKLRAQMKAEAAKLTERSKQMSEDKSDR